eukprot:3754045-Lingulodinium_polyedra.AAC.1
MHGPAGLTMPETNQKHLQLTATHAQGCGNTAHHRHCQRAQTQLSAPRRPGATSQGSMLNL